MNIGARLKLIEFTAYVHFSRFPFDKCRSCILIAFNVALSIFYKILLNITSPVDILANEDTKLTRCHLGRLIIESEYSIIILISLQSLIKCMI